MSQTLWIIVENASSKDWHFYCLLKRDNDRVLNLLKL